LRALRFFATFALPSRHGFVNIARDYANEIGLLKTDDCGPPSVTLSRSAALENNGLRGFPGSARYIKAETL